MTQALIQRSYKVSSSPANTCTSQLCFLEILEISLLFCKKLQWKRSLWLQYCATRSTVLPTGSAGCCYLTLLSLVHAGNMLVSCSVPSSLILQPSSLKQHSANGKATVTTSTACTWEVFFDSALIIAYCLRAKKGKKTNKKNTLNKLTQVPQCLSVLPRQLR